LDVTCLNYFVIDDSLFFPFGIRAQENLDGKNRIRGRKRFCLSCISRFE
jgi:hypothetical protein